MKERPILFSTPMASAIIDGTKTQTRRVVKPQPSPGSTLPWLSPYGVPGDRLWVRETHYRFGHWEPVPGGRTKGGRQKWCFVADYGETLFVPPQGMRIRLGRHHKDPSTPAWHARLARFMPRALSRLTLEVTSARVERLHSITEEDARAEGCSGHDPEPVAEGGTIYAMKGRSSAPSPTAHFRHVWESINGAESWASNLWVWVVGFKRVERVEAQ